MIKNTIILTFCYFFLFFKFAFASTIGEVNTYSKNLGNNIVSVVNNENLDIDQKKQKLIEIFDQHVDVKWISQFVLGRHRKIASKDEKKRFFILYRKFLLESYGAKFKDYGKIEFNVVDVVKKKRFFLVKSNLIVPDNPVINLGIKIKKDKSSSLSVIDIEIEGVSFISTQRSEFMSIISNDGFNSLIQKLKEKTE